MSYESEIRQKAYQKFDGSLIYCANCQNARRVLRPHTITGAPVEKVGCRKGMWKTRISGSEKYLDFFVIKHKVLSGCPHYDPMGENLKDFLEALPNGKADYQPVWITALKGFNFQSKPVENTQQLSLW